MSTRRLARVDAMLERVHATREDFDVPAQDGIVLPGAEYKTDIAVNVGKEQTSET